MASDEKQALKDEAKAALDDGNYARVSEILDSGMLTDADVDEISDAADDLADGNPDDELAEAITELEPAAGEVAQAALDAGRPDLAAEVVEATFTALADWAETAEELADTLEEVADEIGDEGAQAAADDAADASGEAAAAVEETLEEAGVPAEVAAAVTEPESVEPFTIEPDIAPEPSHWLFRRRSMGVR